MGWTYIGYVRNIGAAAGTTLATSAALNLAAGDLVVAWVRWEGSNQTVNSITDGGTNGLTIETRLWNTSVGGCIASKINADANAAATFTVTWGANVSYRIIYVLQFRPDAGETVTKDSGPSPGTGNSTSLASGTINTSGTDEVIIAGGGHYNDNTWSDHAIAAGAATGTQMNYGEANTWYRIFAGDPGDGINATATVNNSNNWVCDILAFKSVAAGGASTIPRYKKYYDMRRAQ